MLHLLDRADRAVTAQGRFPSNHPLNHSPEPIAWGQLSGLAAMRYAVRHKRPQAETALYTRLSHVDSHEDFEDASLAPSGDVLAVVTAKEPTFHRRLSGTERELPTGTIGAYTGSTGAFSEARPAATAAVTDRSHPKSARLDSPGLLTPHVAAAGPCSSRYAYVRGAEARKYDRGPLEVTIYDVQTGAVAHRLTLPAGSHKHPKLAWSTCAGYISLSSEGQAVYVVHVAVEAFVQLETWPGAHAWHPKFCWLLAMSTQLALQVFSFESGQCCCVAQLDLAPFFGPVLPSGAAFAIGATSDGTRVVVGGHEGEGGEPWPVAVAQIAPFCTLLGHCLLQDSLSDFLFLSLCMGCSVCAACAWMFSEGLVHVIALDGPQVGHVLWQVEGLGPALSPCNGYLAVVSNESSYQECVLVHSLQPSSLVVATWSVDGWLGPSPSDYSFGDMHMHQLTWLAAPPLTGSKAAGQLQLNSLLQIKEDGWHRHFTRFFAVLTFG